MTALGDALLAYSPWGLWLCDDASGDFADSSGNNRPINNLGSGLSYQQSMGGAFPGAGDFSIVGDGSANGYALRAQNPGDLADGTIFALAKVAVNQLGTVCGIGAIYHDTNSWGIGYGSFVADRFAAVTNGNSDRADANGNYTPNRWYSVAAVLTSAPLLTLYIDAVAQTNTASFNPADPGAGNVWLFADAVGSAGFAGNGGLSHVAIIPSALTGPQISVLHDTALGLIAGEGEAPNMSPPAVGGWGAC